MHQETRHEWPGGKRAKTDFSGTGRVLCGGGGPLVSDDPRRVRSFLLFHGWGKLAAGQFTIGPTLAKYGIAPAAPLGYVVVFLETVGAFCIILGLGTRIFAAGFAIEMAVIAFKVKMPAGYSQMELFVLLGIVFFAIALRGGGPYSLDRKIGKEL